jgi:hypothetical protein
VFLRVPEDVPEGTVTSTDMLQVPGFVVLPGGMVPPVKLIVFVVVETVPPHEFAVTLTTVNGAGKASERLTPV